MDDEIEGLMVAVRADTRGFDRDVARMRGELEGSLVQGAERAGRAIEGALLRAVRNGRIGFDDLKSLALAVMNDIARAAVKAGVGVLIGRGGGSAGKDGGLGDTLGGLLGLPGRATGGPVAPGRAYLVGERGPELFVPTSSGRVETGAGGGGAREVRVTITVNAAAGAAPEAMARSSRQVARAVKAALEG